MDAPQLASGRPANEAASLMLLPAERRAPVDITLSTIAPGSLLRVAPGASIATEPKGKLTLAGAERVEVFGRLAAPAGSISLSAKSASSTVLTNPGALLVGAGAVLDASGVFVPQTVTPPEQHLGQVLGGGTISLKGDRVQVVVDPGAVLDASGSSA